MRTDVKGPSGQGRRPYRSQARAEGARRTREGIVHAATVLFVDQGYDATSLADVAERAGVARPTVVAAFGAKPTLLSRVLDQALAGDDEPVAVRDRPWFQPVWEAQTGRDALTAYAGVCTLIAARAGRVVEAVRRASDSSPEIEELWRSWLRGRRAGAAMVVEHPPVTRSLREDLILRSAGDILWTLNDPSLYLGLVDDQGWSEPQFRQWLVSTMALLLLDPERADLVVSEIGR